MHNGMENNQSAARSARRFLEDRVRVDWDFPQTPEPWSASDEEERGVTSFRERYYADSSNSETEDDAVDPYKFDSPDSIGDAVQNKRQTRKRKRRAKLEEEMKENEGLRLWVERRDAWTGAASVRKYGTHRESNEKDKDAQLATESDGSRAASVASPSSNAATPMSVDEEPALPSDPSPAETLVPVAHPLLPENSIRQSIGPKAYSDIYNKIVLSSRTPAVPINLADMTRALVQGWQENGEWPPKVGPLDPLAGKKRASIAAVRAENGGEAFLSHHPHMKRGMESVRKIFHLNGGHHEHGNEGAAHGNGHG